MSTLANEPSSNIIPEKRIALVIGVNGKPSTMQNSLHYAVADAETMADIFQNYCDFELLEPPIIGESATSEHIKKAVRKLARDRDDNDFLLLYFSGHGRPMIVEADQRDVYFVSHDFDPDDIDDDENAHVSIRWLRKILYERTKSGKVLLILDCCFSGDIGKTTPDKYLQELKDRIAYYFEAPSSASEAPASGLRLALTATGHNTVAMEKDGHGLMTGVLLPALRGERQQVFNRKGDVSLELLYNFLREEMPTEQQPSLSGDFAGRSCILASYRDQAEKLRLKLSQDINRAEREERLNAMLAEHSGFLQDRLDSFVGRQVELAEIRQRIREKLYTGGYVTITGQAGQGKSSIIAKLVQEYGPKNIAFHFIPFNPGPDHQVGLLRNLMARLILKYDLPDLYVTSESQPVLRDYLPKVLRELVSKGGQEVIFVDGLDQLEEEQSGVRDLSFLPNNPPQGVVFVLGTRPNDTLRPLELLKPHHEYKLPNLSRRDFDLILDNRKVHLKRDLTDRFYEAMQENALYLDLVAKELAETSSLSPVEVIKRVADNPDNIFSLSIDQFKRQKIQWHTILKPILGLLLASREPLRVRHIRQVLNLDNGEVVDDDDVRDGIRRLGGLIAEDGQGGRYLFHLKLQDYLRQDENNSHKEYIFASDEEALWHNKFANWCELNNLEDIWQDIPWDADEQWRRTYAQQHYITHLYLSKEWLQLWKILDKGDYGRGKVRYDPSMRLYAQDLDWGRQAATWKRWTPEKAIALLPFLWRYTLLRCNLASRADSYTTEAFAALLACRHEKEALGLAELLTNTTYKVKILVKIAEYIGKHLNRDQESLQILIRTYEIARLIENTGERIIALQEVGVALTHAQHKAQATEIWIEALKTACSIDDTRKKVQILWELSHVLVLEQQWDQAIQTIHAIDNGTEEKKEAIRNLRTNLIRDKQWELAAVTARYIVNWRERSEAFRELADLLIKEKIWERSINTLSSINAKELRLEAQQQLIQALMENQQWQTAKDLAFSLDNTKEKAMNLRSLGTALQQAQHQTQAIEIWAEALKVASSITMKKQRTEALQDLEKILVREQQWELAETVALSIDENKERAIALQELGAALSQAQQEVQAIKVLAKAFKVALSIDNPSDKAEILLRVGVFLSYIEQETQATKAWTESLKVALSINEGRKKIKALRELETVLIQEQKWELAETIVRSIDDSRDRAIALQELGAALLQTAQEIHAVEILKESLEITHSILDSKTKGETLQKLGVILTRGKLETWATQVWAEAIEAAYYIDEKSNNEKDEENKQERFKALQELSYTLAQAQQWQEAEKVIRSIDDSTEKTKALRELSQELLQAQQWQEAEKVIRSIDDSRNKAIALRELSQELLQAQQWQEAKKVIRSIDDSRDKAVALQELGIALYQRHREIQAAQVLNEVLELTQFTWLKETKIPQELYEVFLQMQQWELAKTAAKLIENTEEKIAALKELCLTLAQEQQWELAKTTARSITNNREKANALQELGITLSREQKEIQATEIFTETLEMVRSIDDSYEKAKALQDLGLTLSQLQKEIQATEIFLEALEVIRSIDDSTEKTKALRELEVELIQGQQWGLAKTTARSITNNREKANALQELGIALSQAQQELQATGIFLEALEVIRSIDDSYEKANALRELEVELIQEQQWELAEDVVDAIEAKDQRINMLFELCKCLAQKQKLQQAEIMLKKIKMTSDTIDVRMQRAIALCKLSETLSQAKLWVEAKEVAYSIELHEQKAVALCKLSETLSQAKLWVEAKEVAYSIELHEQKAVALCSLSRTLIQNQQREQAKAIWIEIKAMTYGIQEGEKLAAALHKLGNEWAQQQQWTWALIVIHSIATTSQKASALCELGEALAQGQQWKKAIAVWGEAEQAIESILEIKQRSILLCNLGTSLSRKQQHEWANEVWTEAKFISRSIREKEQKVEVLCILSYALEQQLRIKQSSEIWAEAEEITRSIEAKNQKVSALCMLSKAQLWRNRWKQSLEIWAEAEEITNSIEAKNQKASALYELSQASIQNRQWEKVLLIADSIETKDLRVSVLEELAEILATLGEHQQLLHLVQHSWFGADIGDYALRLLPLANGLILSNPSIGMRFYEAFAWVDDFLRQ